VGAEDQSHPPRSDPFFDPITVAENLFFHS
jgi:hypothetical protein